MKKFLLMCFSFGFALSVWAQDRVVTGKVTSKEDGSSLPGVNVTIKGTTLGTLTDADGNYRLSAPTEGGTLVFSFVGLKTEEVEIGNRNSIDIQLASDATQLGEVVVVGYGTTTKEAFTGTAKVVSADRITNKNVPNVSRALMGEIAGVQVLNTSGQPGTVATVRIRGFGSINGNQDPLYVVDGVPFTGGLNSINPNDIESTTVLKDAAATAIYGTRGANGVILINTKSGKGVGSFVEVDEQTGTNFFGLPRYSVITSPEQYTALGWEGLYNQGQLRGVADPVAFANSNLFNTSQGISPAYNMWLYNGASATAAQLIDPTTKAFSTDPAITRKYTPENWSKYAYQSALRQQVDIKFGGSNNKTNYYTSIGYLGDKGYIVNSSFERLSGRFNVNHNVNKWLHTAMNIGFVRTVSRNQDQTGDSGDVNWFVKNIPPIYPLYLKDPATGKNVPDPYFGGSQFDYGGNTSRGFGFQTNAVGDNTYNLDKDTRYEVNGFTSLNIDILPGLTLENRLGFQYYNDKHSVAGNKFYGNTGASGGSVQYDLNEMLSYNILDLLRYKKQFGAHDLEVMAAHEATSWSNQAIGTWRVGTVVNNLAEFNNAVGPVNPTYGYTNSWALESYFGQLSYSYNEKYFVSGSLRRDGSSRFLNNKWGTFGSVGAGWLITNENFMRSQNVVNLLKLRASYGVMGDQGANNFNGYYSGYDLYQVNSLNNAAAFAFDTKGNPNLTWETSKMTEVGLDFEVTKYLTGTLDVYQKNTSNLFFNRNVGPSAGYTSVLVNDGMLINKGFEFELTGHILKKEDYFLNLTLNGDVFRNKINRMYIDPATNAQRVLDVATGNYGRSAGHSLYDFYMRQSAGVNSQTGQAQWVEYYDDKNGNNTVDAGEAVASLTTFMSQNPTLPEGELKTTTTTTYSSGTLMYTGQTAIPKVKGAINLVGGYKGIELSVQFLYSLGGYGYDGNYQGLMGGWSTYDKTGSNNFSTDILKRWQNPGDVTSVPRLTNGYYAYPGGTSSRFITKSNFLLLNNVRIGYNFPSAWLNHLKLKSASIWISGDNLWVKSARKGYNPFVTQDASIPIGGGYTPLSTVSGGIKVKF